MGYKADFRLKEARDALPWQARRPHYSPLIDGSPGIIDLRRGYTHQTALESRTGVVMFSGR